MNYGGEVHSSQIAHTVKYEYSNAKSQKKASWGFRKVNYALASAAYKILKAAEKLHWVIRLHQN